MRRDKTKDCVEKINLNRENLHIRRSDRQKKRGAEQSLKNGMIKSTVCYALTVTVKHDGIPYWSSFLFFHFLGFAFAFGFCFCKVLG